VPEPQADAEYRADMEQPQTDFTKLDDLVHLAERARVRDLLEQTPGDANLSRLFGGMNDEFDRRADCAWSKAVRKDRQPE
jgi:hypothetical protein